MNHLYNPTCPRKLLMPFTDDGGGSFSIALIFALSTSIPLAQIRCLSTMPSYTIKWHFSQFRTRLVSSHLISTDLRFSRQLSKEFPNIEKSSMNTSIVFSTISENMAIIQGWNVPGALHSTKGIYLNANVP